MLVDMFDPHEHAHGAGIIRARINPNIGAIELNQLKPEHLDNLYRAMKAGTHGGRGQPLSHSDSANTLRPPLRAQSGA